MKRKLRLILILILIFSIFNVELVFANDDKPNAPERALAWMFRKLGDAGYNVINKYGLSIDTLIYNKATITSHFTNYSGISGSYGNHGVSSDELTNNNSNNNAEIIETFFTESPFLVDFSDNTESPFGIMGLGLNEIFKSLSLILMFIILHLLGFRQELNTTTKNRIELSESMTNYLLAFVMIFWLPKILQLIMMFSNFIVDGFNPSEAIGSNYVDVLRAAAINPNNPFILGDSIIYLGAVLVNVYFIFVYGTRALYLSMLFGFFPLIALYMNNRTLRQSFGNYVSEMFSAISIQWYDAAIFFGISYIFTALGADPHMGLIKFVITCGIIPLRAFFKRLFSFTGRSSVADMAGFAGLMGVVGLTRGIVGGTRSFITGTYGGAHDIWQAGQMKKEFEGAGGNAERAAQNASASRNDVSSPSFSYAGSIGSEMPDIKPYMNKQQGHNAYSFEKDFSSEDGLMIKRRLSPQEAHDYMVRKGIRRIGLATGKAVGGTAGGLVGAAAGSGFGMTGAIYGAQVGGIIGGGLGEGAGALAGLGGAYSTQLIMNVAREYNASNEGKSSDVVNAGSVAVYKSAGGVQSSNNLNYADSSNVNIIPSSGSKLEHSSGKEMGYANVDSKMFQRKYEEYSQNLSNEERDKIYKDASSYVNQFMSGKDFSGWDSSILNEFRDEIMNMALSYEGFNYTIDRLKAEGKHHYDYDALRHFGEAWRDGRVNDMYEAGAKYNSAKMIITRYGNNDGDIDINAI